MIKDTRLRRVVPQRSGVGHELVLPLVCKIKPEVEERLELRLVFFAGEVEVKVRGTLAARSQNEPQRIVLKAKLCGHGHVACI